MPWLMLWLRQSQEERRGRGRSLSSRRLSRLGRHPTVPSSTRSPSTRMNRFSNLLRCFHNGHLGDFAAEPQRARRKVGGVWRERVERLGLERGPPSPQHSANAQRPAFALHPSLHRGSPCLRQRRLDESTSLAHDLRRTRRSALRPERASQEVGAGGAGRRSDWDVAGRRCPLISPSTP